MRKILLCISILSLFFLFGCEEHMGEEVKNILFGHDYQIPKIISSKAINAHTIEILFDEMIFCNPCDFSINQSAEAILSVHPYEHKLTIVSTIHLEPARQISLEGRVRDACGNTLRFLLQVWGKNENIPQLLISEFTTKGTSTQPDRLELYAITSGNLAGITIYDGIGHSFDSECILPSFEVSQGDYIVIEYSNSLRGAHPIEFWGGESGFGANNGIITVCDSPHGSIIDAVLYSNRTSSSDTLYGGFGTKKVQERAILLQASGQWYPNNPITPEGGIQSTSSTSTRSFCRNMSAIDSNTSSDWYIVPTGKASFGAENCTEVYK